MTKTTTIDLMRHGEPVGGRRYRGQIDDPLSDKGWSQMRQAVAGHSPWKTIISSPLRRCSEFARELSEQLEIALEFDTRLKEVGFGTWEGLTGDQVQKLDDQALQKFYNDPTTHRPAGAEPLDAFSERVNQAYLDIVHRHAGQHILILTHAGVIRSILQETLLAPLASMYRISIDTASLTRIQISSERPPTVQFVGRSSI
ncbi:MAG: alpha-ribazole phosphatase family protein [Candidatus Thiodiazotropha sp.]|jgi:alpha-ribazole phosphatase